MKRVFYMALFLAVSLTPISSEERINNLILYKGIKNSPNRVILDSIDPKLMLVYSAPNEQYQLTIFTDVFCPYCRTLHQNLDVFLQNGITVRYLLFPLSKASIPVLTSIVCADDPAKSLDIAMIETKYSTKTCNSTTLAESRDIARTLQVFGTPSIFLQDGRKVSGFMSPEEVVDGLRGRLNFDEWRPKHLRK